MSKAVRSAAGAREARIFRDCSAIAVEVFVCAARDSSLHVGRHNGDFDTLPLYP